MRPLCALLLFAAALSLGCGRDSSHQYDPNATFHGGKSQVPNIPPIDLPKGETKKGTAIAILLDTSGSMSQAVRDKDGKMRPKNAIANDALQQIIAKTAAWKEKHPNDLLELGIYQFASSVSPVLPMGPFDRKKAEEALKKIASPNGNTAIGRALEQGFKALFATGCDRKFVLCLSDGENTSGPAPEYMSQRLFDASQKSVAIHFVAFDTSKDKFGFLEKVNGQVYQADDEGQLQTHLTTIYEKRILAEVPEEGK